MSYSKLFLLLGIALMALLSSCSDEPKADNGNIEDIGTEYSAAKYISLSSNQKEVVASISNFANSLFNTTSQLKKDDNFIISPLGASFTLSMVANAANAETREQILEVLGIEDDEIESLNSLNKTLLLSLPASSKCSLNTFNSFWYNSIAIPQLNPSFISSLGEYYQAQSFGVTSEEYVGKANSWIEEKTNKGIQNFLKPDEGADFAMSFFNIMDFMGSWSVKGKVPTEPMTFHNANGSNKELTSLLFDEIFAWSTGYGYVFDIPYIGAVLNKAIS